MRVTNWFTRLCARGRYRISGFVGLDIQEAGDTETMGHETGVSYRLLVWPELRPAYRTAPIYRALSVMSAQPVEVARFSRLSGVPIDQAQDVLNWLVSQGFADELTQGTGKPEVLAKGADEE